MTMPTVRNFTMHGSLGHAVLRSKWLDWVAAHQGLDGCNRENGFGFGETTHYTWDVDGQQVVARTEPGKYWCELPDASGFIVFEREWKPDNCVLLDAYGKERMRLTVPWQLTKPKNPKSANAPTSFNNVSSPFEVLIDGKKSEFGVTAWVEHAGDYYFELDYHTGKFLWGKEIRS